MIKLRFVLIAKNKIAVTNSRESALKRHAGLAPSEDKGKNHKLRTPVAGKWEPSFGHLKKPEVTNDSVKMKYDLTI